VPGYGALSKIVKYCGGRALGFGVERMEKVAADLKGVRGQVPFVGFCTFGEQGYAKWTANVGEEAAVG
jgi:hypothetical protein